MKNAHKGDTVSAKLFLLNRVFGFCFLKAGSLPRAAFALFLLGSLFATQMSYFWFFGQSLVLANFALSDWQVALMVPAIICIVFVAMVLMGNRKPKTGSS